MRTGDHNKTNMQVKMFSNQVSPVSYMCEDIPMFIYLIDFSFHVT